MSTFSVHRPIREDSRVVITIGFVPVFSALFISLIGLGILIVIVVFSWGYTSIQLSAARSKGVYASPEQGMLAMADRYYTADKTVKIVYAGTNSFDGSNPHVWYVIAEANGLSKDTDLVSGMTLVVPTKVTMPPVTVPLRCCRPVGSTSFATTKLAPSRSPFTPISCGYCRA
jgi:hypothetical protein